jgi:glutaredoxin
MLDRVRDVLYRAITTPRGDSVLPVRVPKDLARRLNTTLGRPLASREELAKRNAARARLAALGDQPSSDNNRARAEPAPVLVYFERDRNVRELTRIEELLGTRGIAWKRLDVAGDEATIDFVTRQAKCERDDLPVVFVADQVVGGYDDLVRANVSGELERLMNGP